MRDSIAAAAASAAGKRGMEQHRLLLGDGCGPPAAQHVRDDGEHLLRGAAAAHHARERPILLHRLQCHTKTMSADVVW
jgi:hypothetical protein